MVIVCSSLREYCFSRNTWWRRSSCRRRLGWIWSIHCHYLLLFRSGWLRCSQITSFWSSSFPGFKSLCNFFNFLSFHCQFFLSMGLNFSRFWQEFSLRYYVYWFWLLWHTMWTLHSDVVESLNEILNWLPTLLLCCECWHRDLYIVFIKLDQEHLLHLIPRVDGFRLLSAEPLKC